MQNETSDGSTKSSEVTPSSDIIRAHLARVLASPAFRTSKRSARFLDFIIAETIAGRATTLKERTLAVEVFDRSASFDSGDDTIVRVGAREVRKRLSQFYASPEGTAETLRIELPLGSYVPEFTHPASAVVPTRILPVSPPPSPVPIRSKSRTWRWLFVPVLLLSAVGMWRVFGYDRPSPFDVFWHPLLRSTDPVILVLANPLVYSPTARAYALNSRRFGAPLTSTVPLKLPPDALNGSDFVPQPDGFVAFGDAVAASNVQVLFAQHRQEFRLRFASKVEFADLRDTPAVMIGAFTNRWTMELTQRLRFYFGYDAHWVPGILDRNHPGHGWNISQKKDDGSSPEDFFLVSRLMNSPSGNLVIIGAGVAQFGTQAAGRFITNKAAMNTALRGLRKDWPSHNVELVMHARVIGDSPATPELVASYVW